jgi:hypothetical protein
LVREALPSWPQRALEVHGTTPGEPRFALPNACSDRPELQTSQGKCHGAEAHFPLRIPSFSCTPTRTTDESGVRWGRGKDERLTPDQPGPAEFFRQTFAPNPGPSHRVLPFLVLRSCRVAASVRPVPGESESKRIQVTEPHPTFRISRAGDERYRSQTTAR